LKSLAVRHTRSSGQLMTVLTSTFGIVKTLTGLIAGWAGSLKTDRRQWPQRLRGYWINGITMF
jgi:hypothetical protein